MRYYLWRKRTGVKVTHLHNAVRVVAHCQLGDVAHEVIQPVVQASQYTDRFTRFTATCANTKHVTSVLKYNVNVCPEPVIVIMLKRYQHKQTNFLMMRCWVLFPSVETWQRSGTHTHKASWSGQADRPNTRLYPLLAGRITNLTGVLDWHRDVYCRRR